MADLPDRAARRQLDLAVSQTAAERTTPAGTASPEPPPPGAPSQRAAPDTPGPQGTPGTPETPGAPGALGNPGTPDGQNGPNTPDKPDGQNKPNEPDGPNAPNEENAPNTPDILDEEKTAVPQQAARRAEQQSGQQSERQRGQQAGQPRGQEPAPRPRQQSPAQSKSSPHTRWTDPQVASAYARRDESLDRSLLWPLLAEQLRPAEARRATGRPDAEVLEIGAGLGGLSHLLATTQWTRAYAVDLSPAIHRAGVPRYQDDWVKRILPSRSSWRFPLDNQLCTGAVAQFLLLHLRHPAEVVGVLSEARRVLRTGAPLVLLEPGGHGGPAGTVQWGGTRWGEPAHDAPGRSSPEPEEGEPFLAHYRLRGGATFSASAWYHSPAALAGCLRCCGFRLAEIMPLTVPGAHTADPPFHLWRAVAE